MKNFCVLPFVNLEARTDGTIAPYPSSAPSGGMSGGDLESFLAAQGFEVTEEREPRKIGFVAAMNRDKELKDESRGSSLSS